MIIIMMKNQRNRFNKTHNEYKDNNDEKKIKKNKTHNKYDDNNDEK